MRKLQLFCSLILTMLCFPVTAQIQEPVKFKTEWKELSANEAEIVFSATIEKGWHVYSTEIEEGGPTPATFNIDKIEGAELIGKLTPIGNEIKQMDPIFEMEVKYFEDVAKFSQKIKLTGGNYTISGFLEYGACNDASCLPPTSVDFSYTGKIDKPVSIPESTKTKEDIVKTTIADKEDTTAVLLPSIAENTIDTTNYWRPVINELNHFETQTSSKSHSWIYIFFAGVVGGLLALFTPCVWPIIPMTVSFFLKRTKDKKKGIRDAWTYGASIVVIYVALGLAITLIFGASALNALSTNAIFNIFFFLMLVVFAASFFGAFEITLPSKWSNAVDSKAEATTGLLSIFLMAFTLSLVSFSCTGPIIGFLLVEVSTTGSIIAPALGMLGFAIALALPFTLFAMFPSWLKSMPKSGGWMNAIKVVLGFLELAFALKFLSVADLAYGWRLLDRETFLALWIVIFGLLGFYLLGKRQNQIPA